MENITLLPNENRIYDYKKAMEILPILHKITAKHEKKVSQYRIYGEATIIEDLSIQKKIQQLIDLEVETWKKKVQKLGLQPKGLWYVDIDNGNGYYCWKFPENEIGYSHGYKDGFSRRIPVHENSTSTNQLPPG